MRNEEPLAVYAGSPGSVSSNIASQGVNNRKAYELALRRGNLTRKQARIARNGVRYNRAMEEVALVRFSDGNALRSASRVPRLLPLLAWVAAANVRCGLSGRGCCDREGPGRGAAPRAPMNDDVTIVITCFNYGRYLPEAVQSALDQAGGEPRVTVVDDGSTDETTRRELERLPERVELIRQANRGVAAARNAGLGRVQTDYALVLDADDRLVPAALSMCGCARGRYPAWVQPRPHALLRRMGRGADDAGI